MSLVELHNVDEAVERIARELTTSSPRRPTWSVLGEPTAGKTAVLEQLHERLAAEGTVRPVLLSPPPRAYDAAHVALVELAEGLYLAEPVLKMIKDPQRPWHEKLKRVRATLGREGRVVVLLDEPATWLPRETYFRSFVHDVWDVVFDVFDTTAVTAGHTPFHVQHHRAVHLAPGSDPEGVLGAIASPALAEPKAEVHARFGDHLAELSPLQIRLLVAIAALRAPVLNRIQPTSIQHRSQLVPTLAELVDAGNVELRDVWLHLAAVREPFEADLLRLVGGRRLDDVEHAIATDCLLFVRRGRLFLHESLRGIVNLIEHDETTVHTRLAGHYRHRFDDPESGIPVRMRDSIEAFHHASSAGIVDLDSYRPFFVDQLNILGYHLSVDRSELDRAAAVFRLALDWDPRNAYAAHYRAFNLDRLVGTPGAEVDPREVGTLYRLAVEERPSHPWFRSRLITFLIAEGRIDEAWFEWLRASEAVGPDPSDFVCFGLHLHVARALVYRGELEHAESVLRALPRELMLDERFAVIHERIDALREARDHGSYVPSMYLEPGWWLAPKLLPEANLDRWLASRVTDVSSAVVELDVADITGESRPVFGTLELPRDTLEPWWRGPGELSSLEPGDFIEIGFYGVGDDAQAIAVRHPHLRWPDLARPQEDPDRYLRAAT